MKRNVFQDGPVLAAKLAMGFLLLAGLVGSGVDDASLSFAGRVIEKETGKPIAEALVVVTLSKPGTRGVETSLKTDAEGRFAFSVTPQQAAQPGFRVAVSKVDHPGFVRRKGYPVSMSSLLLDRQAGGTPYFATVTLDRGLEFSGEVVGPDGQPVADLAIEFLNWSGTNPAPNFADDTTCRSDAQGQFRVRMPKTPSLAVRMTPVNLAPFQKFWGTNRPAENLDVFVPTDLGRIVLEPGLILSGRSIDIEGRPIAGLRVIAQGSTNQFLREATTGVDGSFRFAPLRPGNYVVYADGQYHSASIDQDARPMLANDPVIRPAKVYLREGQNPEALELRELPSARVEVRFVDSKGKPAPGSFISLAGTIPSEADRTARSGGSFTEASAINEVEPEETDKRLGWGCQLSPDAEGRVTFRVPRGLTDARLYTVPDDSVAYKTRLAKDVALKFWGGGQLGTIDADRSGIEIVCYKAPVVIASVKTEDGEPVPQDVKIENGFDFRGFSYSDGVIRQADGRFRSQGFMPDHEYHMSARANGYVPKSMEWVDLPEGGSVELTLVIRKKPRMPVVGDLAPPFAVARVDGRFSSLADFRGKYLLIHAWSPYHRQDRDLLKIEPIRKRFGDDRVALLGLVLTIDSDEASKVIQQMKITWPQAILRGQMADPMVQDYDFQWPMSRSYLIGPDGTLLARDIAADKVEEILARALGEK